MNNIYIEYNDTKALARGIWHSQWAATLGKDSDLDYVAKLFSKWRPKPWRDRYYFNFRNIGNHPKVWLQNTINGPTLFYKLLSGRHTDEFFEYLSELEEYAQKVGIPVEQI